jgi:ASPIC and UnbV
LDVGDPFGTGRPALLIGASLFQNQANRPLQRGTRRPDWLTYSASTVRTAKDSVWATTFIDFDNDGWEDILAVTGGLERNGVGQAVQQQPAVLRNLGWGILEPQISRPGDYFSLKHRGRGLAVGDLDNDGWPDVVISHVGEPVTILRNDGRFLGNHWLGVQLATRDHRDLCGTVVRLHCNDKTLTRFVKAGGSYLSASHSKLVFGLERNRQARQIRVQWASGEPADEVWVGLEADRYHRLLQGTGRAPSPPSVWRAGSKQTRNALCPTRSADRFGVVMSTVKNHVRFSVAIGAIVLNSGEEAKEFFLPRGAPLFKEDVFSMRRISRGEQRAFLEDVRKNGRPQSFCSKRAKISLPVEPQAFAQAALDKLGLEQPSLAYRALSAY